jgi:uncharacterized XkdX family phage protein
MFEKVKRFYDLGLYTKAQVGRFVAKNVLTAEQYEAITGEAFPG